MLEEALALPVHPVFVHFPIAMLSVTWGLVVAHYWSGSIAADRLVAPFEWIGVGFLPIVILTGLRDAEWLDFVTEVEWDQPLIWHFIVSLTASALFTAHVLWRRQRGADGNGRWIDLGLTTAGFWLLVLTGLIAGEMVYG